MVDDGWWWFSGWWLTYPSEKWWSSSVGITVPNRWKVIKLMFQTTNQSWKFWRYFVATQPVLRLSHNSLVEPSEILYESREDSANHLSRSHGIDWKSFYHVTWSCLIFCGPTLTRVPLGVISILLHDPRVVSSQLYQPDQESSTVSF